MEPYKYRLPVEKACNMDSLITPIEIQFILSVFKQHFPYLTNLESTLARLRVTSREVTGVGLYVNFSKHQEKLLPEGTTRQLGFDGEVSISRVPSGVGLILAIDDGIISYLELFTYGDEQWDGSTTGAKITESIN
jgi:hypothetical protein